MLTTVTRVVIETSMTGKEVITNKVATVRRVVLITMNTVRRETNGVETLALVMAHQATAVGNTMKIDSGIIIVTRTGDMAMDLIIVGHRNSIGEMITVTGEITAIRSKVISGITINTKTVPGTRGKVVMAVHPDADLRTSGMMTSITPRTKVTKVATKAAHAILATMRINIF